MSTQKEDRRFKVIFLGDSGVGKTSIIHRRTKNSFDINMEPTVGLNNVISELTIDNTLVSLRIWDTAGQENFESFLPLYMRDTQFAIIVSSITDHLSTEHFAKWSAMMKKYDPNTRQIFVVNKIDLQSEKLNVGKLQSELLRGYQEVFFVSAKTGAGIEDIFLHIGEQGLLIKDQEMTNQSRNNAVKRNEIEKDKNRCCGH